jgi:hypothetical protein
MFQLLAWCLQVPVIAALAFHPALPMQIVQQHAYLPRLTHDPEQ